MNELMREAVKDKVKRYIELKIRLDLLRRKEPLSDSERREKERLEHEFNTLVFQLRKLGLQI